MNLIDALKSGRPFRRQEWVGWVDLKEERLFSAYEIVADDWEIQEPTVTITEAKLVDAVKTTASWLELYQPAQKTKAIGDPNVTWLSFAQELAKELGLKDGQ